MMTKKSFHFINSLDTGNVFLHVMTILKVKHRIKRTSLDFAEESLNFNLLILSLQRSNVLE